MTTAVPPEGLNLQCPTCGMPVEALEVIGPAPVADDVPVRVFPCLCETIAGNFPQAVDEPVEDPATLGAATGWEVGFQMGYDHRGDVDVADRYVMPDHPTYPRKPANPFGGES